jgi:uncharacterized membrane protein (UPF0127 family)
MLLGCGSFINKTNRVCHNKYCFEVELARDQEEWTKGLQDRLHMDENKGMLFIFLEPSNKKFWMKDTLIPLDIIWLDYASRIVHIDPNVPPCRFDPCPTYGPDKKINYVLELNGGMAAKAGMKVGDRLDIICKFE